MACNEVLTPPAKPPPPPQIGNPLPVLTFYCPPPAENKKHEDVKLMHKPLIQHKSCQIKKKVKSPEIQ